MGGNVRQAGGYVRIWNEDCPAPGAHAEVSADRERALWESVENCRNNHIVEPKKEVSHWWREKEQL